MYFPCRQYCDANGVQCQNERQIMLLHLPVDGGWEVRGYATDFKAGGPRREGGGSGILAASVCTCCMCASRAWAQAVQCHSMCSSVSAVALQ